MSATNPQAILGVTVGRENTIMVIYPTTAATGIGRMLGKLYNCIPLKVMGIKLSVLLFALPTAPIATVIYSLQKIAGVRYELTNQSVKAWRMLLGTQSQLLHEVPLSDITEVAVYSQDGQEFFKAGDVHLQGAGGKTLLTLDGVSRPLVVRRNILEARDSRSSVADSMAVIAAR